jgi:hypothetical protein
VAQSVLNSDEIEALDLRADAIHASTLRPAHPSILSYAAQEMGAIVRQYRRLLGDFHVDTLKARGRWADLMVPVYFYRDDAGASYEALLRDYERAFGTDHPRTLRTRLSIEQCRMNKYNATKSDASRAVGPLESIVRDTNMLLGPGHPQTFLAREELARARLYSSGNRMQAARELEQLLMDSRRRFGPKNFRTFKFRLNLSKATADLEQIHVAVAAVKELLNEAIRELGGDHATTMSIKSWQEALSTIVTDGGRLITLGPTGEVEELAQVTEGEDDSGLDNFYEELRRYEW